MVKEDSIRLVCPVCKHQHTEADKKMMNIQRRLHSQGS